MVFTSHIFVFYFLPACLLIYYLLPYRWRNLFLTIVSYVFYGWWKPWFVSLMMISTVVDYTAGRIISAEGASPRRRKTALIVSICTNLGLLGIFKYLVFLQNNINAALDIVGASTFDALDITLPIGISFYTFQTMSYSIDVYRGVAPPVRRFNDFSCFVALFPQLIAGPIVRYNTVAEQLATRTHTIARFASGASMFMLGFSKKILLANPAGAIADSVFALDGSSPLMAWWGVTAYAFQIYFDFSGYSDMAIGLGRMLGFEFPKNFNSPYHAHSITDFWRRWHISLSTFLRDYLYIPLGGNRGSERRTYINLAIVMLLGGLWHGAHWQFMLWGAYHGIWLGLERWMGKKAFYSALPHLFRVVVTFVLVLFSWVPFRADNLGASLKYFGSMFGVVDASPGSYLVGAEVFTTHSVVMMGICLVFVCFRTQSWDFVQRLTWPKVVTVLVLFVLACMAMFTQAFNPFLYFQF
ncbi:MBOAT family O-acyltransferase [Myxococcota bacterium]